MTEQKTPGTDQTLAEAIEQAREQFVADTADEAEAEAAQAQADAEADAEDKSADPERVVLEFKFANKLTIDQQQARQLALNYLAPYISSVSAWMAALPAADALADFLYSGKVPPLEQLDRLSRLNRP